MSGPAASTGRQVASRVAPGRRGGPAGQQREPDAGLDRADARGPRLRSGAQPCACPWLRCLRLRGAVRGRLAAPAQGLRAAAEGRRRARFAEPVQVVVAKAVQVPSVIGLGLAKALAALDAAMLQGRPDRSDGDRDVRAQQPAAGSEAPPHGAVSWRRSASRRCPPWSGCGCRMRRSGSRPRGSRTNRTMPTARRAQDRRPAAAGGRARRGRQCRRAVDPCARRSWCRTCC